MIATCGNAREVMLREGCIALVDAADFDCINAFKWRLTHRSCGVYATTTIKSKNILMHRMILGRSVNDSINIDHIDGNPLNNCRSNLRIATPQQNAWNRKLSIRNKSSQYKAVSRRPSGMWCARVRSGERCWCAAFETEELAARAYDVVAVEWFGEFARLNFPGEIEASREIVRDSFKQFRRGSTDREAILRRHVADEVAP